MVLCPRLSTVIFAYTYHCVPDPVVIVCRIFDLHKTNIILSTWLLRRHGGGFGLIIALKKDFSKRIIRLCELAVSLPLLWHPRGVSFFGLWVSLQRTILPGNSVRRYVAPLLGLPDTGERGASVCGRDIVRSDMLRFSERACGKVARLRRK